MNDEEFFDTISYICHLLVHTIGFQISGLDLKNAPKDDWTLGYIVGYAIAFIEYMIKDEERRKVSLQAVMRLAFPVLFGEAFWESLSSHVAKGLVTSELMQEGAEYGLQDSKNRIKREADGSALADVSMGLYGYHRGLTR